jgi:hypothetical protein
MEVRLDINAKAFMAGLEKGPKRLAYAVERALNRTGLLIQKEMRQKVVGDFTVRQRTFITRNIAKIEKSGFAKVREGRAFLEIAVAKVPKLHLADFERGGPVPPWAEAVAGGFVPMPVFGGPARKTPGAKTPKKYKLSNIQFHRTTTRGGKEVLVSNERDFYAIPGVGIFERTGESRKQSKPTRLVYFFFPTLTFDERLGFIETGRRIGEKFFPVYLDEAKREALAYQSGRE